MFRLESLRRVTSGSSYLPVIDGLRFIAIMPVVLFHLNSRTWRAYSSHAENVNGQALFETLNRWLGAKTGVELFFVISGFILAMPFLRANASGRQSPSLKSFYLRRLTRLEPPYLIATLLAFIFLWLTTSSTGKINFTEQNGYSMVQSLFASLFYLHGPLFQDLPQIIPVAWSLEIEFQFYIVAPLLFYIFLSIKSLNRRMLSGAIFVVGLVILINPVQAEIGNLIRFVLLRYLHFFLVGFLLCQLFLKRGITAGRNNPRYIWDGIFLFSLIMLMGSETMMRDYRKPTPVPLELIRLLAFIFLFYSAFSGRWVTKILSSAPIALIGGMCYSIYLMHLPLQQVLVPKVVAIIPSDGYASVLILVSAVILPLTLLASFTFYLLIERPCMYQDWPQRLYSAVKFGRKEVLTNRLQGK